jgi:hypothetical protein
MTNLSRPEPPPLAAFTYVDTAVNGAQHRNHVMPLAEFRPPSDACDVFATYFRFTRDLLDYAAANSHVAPHKRPSVKGYRGLAFAPFVPADFDCEGSPDRARADAIRAVRMLHAQHDVPPPANRIYFSGHKGFSLEIPGALFGTFTPAADLPGRLKSLAYALFADYATLDTTIYETVRLWRWPNSRHAKSGLYKIRLSRAELEGLDLEAIRALAAVPRPCFADAPDDDWYSRAGLIAAWAATSTLETGHRDEPAEAGVPEGSRPLSPKEQHALASLMHRYWFVGQKHNVALGLAGWLALAGVPESQGEMLFRKLSVDDQKPDDRLRCLHDSYHRRRLGHPVAGPSRLREYLPPHDMDALARILTSRRGRQLAIIGGRLHVGKARLRTRESVHA